MKTNVILSAFAAIVLSSAFSFNANASETPQASVSSDDYYILNELDRVKANTTDVWTVTLHRGETYMFIVEGDGDTDLDLYVYDDEGNRLASDTDNTDRCLCFVTARWTGSYKVKVKNYGSVYNEYRIKVI